MISRWICWWVLSVGLFPLVCVGQAQADGAEEAMMLHRALKISSLTYEGRPFHTVLEIGKAGDEYSGRIEAWWVEATKYRLVVNSPKFSQVRVVNGDLIYEKNDGDYYPRWLENFVSALMDPIPMAEGFRRAGPQVSVECLKHEDKPGGITNELTFAMVCTKDSDSRLDFAMTFAYFMDFKDEREFLGKEVARTYQTRVKDFEAIYARMTMLEELGKRDEALFVVPQPTPLRDRITTSFVSTLKEESLIENVPELQWPDVREGKTDGYMIVYARTDRTGQVRETAKHNSDNAAVQKFGMEAALKYKFKPYVLNGVAQQMEMPLVLHFTSNSRRRLVTLFGNLTMPRQGTNNGMLIAT